MTTLDTLTAGHDMFMAQIQTAWKLIGVNPDEDQKETSEEDRSTEEPAS